MLCPSVSGQGCFVTVYPPWDKRRWKRRACKSLLTLGRQEGLLTLNRSGLARLPVFMVYLNLLLRLPSVQCTEFLFHCPVPHWQVHRPGCDGLGRDLDVYGRLQIVFRIDGPAVLPRCRRGCRCTGLLTADRHVLYAQGAADASSSVVPWELPCHHCRRLDCLWRRYH